MISDRFITAEQTDLFTDIKTQGEGLRHSMKLRGIEKVKKDNKCSEGAVSVLMSKVWWKSVSVKRFH